MFVGEPGGGQHLGAGVVVALGLDAQRELQRLRRLQLVLDEQAGPGEGARGRDEGDRRAGVIGVASAAVARAPQQMMARRHQRFVGELQIDCRCLVAKGIHVVAVGVVPVPLDLERRAVRHGARPAGQQVGAGEPGRQVVGRVLAARIGVALHGEVAGAGVPVAAKADLPLRRGVGPRHAVGARRVVMVHRQGVEPVMPALRRSRRPIAPFRSRRRRNAPRRPRRPASPRPAW